MKYFRIAWLSGLVPIVLMAMLAGTAMAGDLSVKKVVVVSGVSKAQVVATGYNLVYDGIDEGFNGSGITPVYQWAEMTYLTTDAQKTKAGNLAIASARAEKPDLIIVVDDDALKFIGAKIDDIPIVFAFIFGSPKTLGLPRQNVTGIIRASYAADIWGLTNKLFGVKTVALISKYSAPMAGIKQVLAARAALLQKACGVLYKDTILCETFDDWKKAVTTWPYDFIYMADPSRIVKDGKEMARADVVRWTVANAKVPVIAASEKDVASGALFSIVTSEKGIGKLASETALDILNGAPISQAYTQSKKGKLVFNAKTIQKYKVEIPYEILSTADNVYE